MSDNGKIHGPLPEFEGEPGDDVSNEVRGMMTLRELCYLRCMVGDLLLHMQMNDALQAAIRLCDSCRIVPGHVCGDHLRKHSEWTRRWARTVEKARRAVDGIEGEALHEFVRVNAENVQHFNEALKPLTAARHGLTREGPPQVPQAVQGLRLAKPSDSDFPDLSGGGSLRG